jgi:hypothetical protein
VVLDRTRHLVTVLDRTSARVVVRSWSVTAPDAFNR